MGRKHRPKSVIERRPAVAAPAWVPGRRLANALAGVALGLVLVGHLAVNWRTFFIHHYRGDQRSYVGVAMKIARRGYGEYSMRNVRMLMLDGRYLALEYAADDGEGDLIRVWRDEGMPCYDQPLYHAPPLFPTLVVLSHGLFGTRPEYLVVHPAADRIPENPWSAERFKAQFYCTVVPLLFGGLTLVATFLLGALLCARWVGVFAAALVGFSPAHILASQHVWADTLLACVTTSAGLLFCLASKRESRRLAVLSGVAFGLGLLTKVSASLLVLPVAALAWWQGGERNRPVRARVADVAIFLAVGVLLALPWYVLMTRALGSPFFNISQPGISKTHPWFQYSNSRPWYTFLLGIPHHVPVYWLGYAALAAIAGAWLGASAVAFVRRRGGPAPAARRRETHGLPAVALSVLRRPGAEVRFLAAWFMTYLVILSWSAARDEMLGPDHRYMLPAYPALAVLSAIVLRKARDYVNARIGWRLGDVASVAGVAACAVWSIRLTMRCWLGDEVAIPW